MKISPTRFSVALVLTVQWLSVAAVILIGNCNHEVFADFRTELPLPTIIAFQATRSALLLPFAAAITIFVIAAESLLKSETARFVVQIINLCFWLMFVCSCLVAVMLPFFGIFTKLS